MKIIFAMVMNKKFSFSKTALNTFLLILLVSQFQCTRSLDSDNNLARKESKERSLEEVLKADSAQSTDNTVQTAAAEVDSIPYPAISYTRIKIRDKKHLDSIKKSFFVNKEFTAAYRAISTLNRKEYVFFRVKDSILVPDQVIDDQKAYSLFPHTYPQAASFKKLIVVSIMNQCYGAYEFGKLVHFAAINSGKHAGSNPQGLYYLTWKARSHTSSYDETWIMPYTFNYTRIGQAFHQYQMPGYPASHGCLRQFTRDAEWLFTWGETRKIDPATKKWGLRTGTPVIIIDQYDYENRYKPWRYLKSNREGIIGLPPDPMGLEERF